MRQLIDQWIFHNITPFVDPYFIPPSPPLNSFYVRLIFESIIHCANNLYFSYVNNNQVLNFYFFYFARYVYNCSIIFHIVRYCCMKLLIYYT